MRHTNWMDGQTWSAARGSVLRQEEHVFDPFTCVCFPALIQVILVQVQTRTEPQSDAPLGKGRSPLNRHTGFQFMASK